MAKRSTMRSPRQHGDTLIEVMCAMAIILIGAAGVLSVHAQGVKMDGDARHVTRAAEIAQDLADQIALWPYADARLANTSPANDAALADPGYTFEFETHVNPVSDGIADHGEADLGATWTGISTAGVTTLGYERFWNVAYADDLNSNGVWDNV